LRLLKNPLDESDRFRHHASDQTTKVHRLGSNHYDPVPLQTFLGKDVRGDLTVLCPFVAGLGVIHRVAGSTQHVDSFP
jgi:hypothetical protein